MDCLPKQQSEYTHTCCEDKDSLCSTQIAHLINVIKQRYMSPYKIIYMINQPQADYFKSRNQGRGCCSSSQITIPKDQMTKTQLYLSEAITQSFRPKNLNQILEQLSDKFENIVKSGEKQNLKVDDQVEKFLIEKTLSQGFNLHLYKVVMERLKQQSESISNSAMLWATPNTWYAKYPKTPLNFLSGQTLANLNSPNKGVAFESNFLSDYKDNLLKELKLLQQDGKFQEQIWLKELSQTRNDTKILNFLEKYAFDGTQDSYRPGQIVYPNLKKSLLTLRSIPFELNEKLNAYCTISQNNQISFFKNSIIYKVKENPKLSRYSTFCFIGQTKIKCTTKSKKSKEKIEEKILKSGQLALIDNQVCQIELQGEGNVIFLFRSWINTLAKKF